MAMLDVRVDEPVWDIAKLFPAQGTWSEQVYLALDTNRLVEFSNGYIEVLDMPSQKHQFSVMQLLFMLRLYFRIGVVAGTYIVSPMKAKLWDGKFREPDLMVMLAENAERRHDLFWERPDLIVEVVSPDDPKRDLETKRREYAMAGIPEYWIVNPLNETVTVLTLEGSRYVASGVYGRGEMAESVLLEGFSAEVTEVFSQP